jgi:hypothetical protein
VPRVDAQNAATPATVAPLNPYCRLRGPTPTFRPSTGNALGRHSIPGRAWSGIGWLRPTTARPDWFHYLRPVGASAPTGAAGRVPPDCEGLPRLVALRLRTLTRFKNDSARVRLERVMNVYDSPGRTRWRLLMASVYRPAPLERGVETPRSTGEGCGRVPGAGSVMRSRSRLTRGRRRACR